MTRGFSPKCYHTVSVRYDFLETELEIRLSILQAFKKGLYCMMSIIQDSSSVIFLVIPACQYFDSFWHWQYNMFTADGYFSLTMLVLACY